MAAEAIKDPIMKNSLNSDLLCRPEYLGLQSLLSPFIQHCSAQRSMMWGSHSSQALVVDSSEQPRCMTGYEEMVGKEELTEGSQVEHDMVIQRVIPKFNISSFNDSTIHNIPSWTVIYTDENHVVHSMEVSTYTLLHDGFGYFNVMKCLEEERLYVGNMIEKGTKLTTSPSHKGHRWQMGMNANVVYMGEWGSTEDACVISRSLSERGTNTAIHQTKLIIGPDDIPLDLYGDELNYKCFPGIGETVRSDGVLIGLRTNNEGTFVSDMIPSRLREPEPIHDELHRAPPGSQVIDVDVYINRDALKKMHDRDDNIYKQFLDLHKSQEYFHNSVLDAYTKLCTKDGEDLPCSQEFNTLVVNSACMSNNRKFVNKNIKLYDARDPVEFITVVITYAYKRKVTLGSKLTDRYGGKGVVSAIWEDENMPVDDFGNRADIIMTPASIINRMNPAQMYEQFWNRTALEVMNISRRKWLNADKNEQRDWEHDQAFNQNWKHIYAFILEFFRDFRPNYAQFIDECHPNDNLRKGFVIGCLHEGLYLINGFRKPNSAEDIVRIAKKYGVQSSPVTYRVQNKETGAWKTVRSKTDMLIGSKYLLELCKIPAADISAISVGYVSQHETPIKPKSKHIKSQNVIGLTPQKFGEDETCISVMSVGPAVMSRLYGLHATAPECVKELAETLLKEPTPSAIPCIPETTQDVINKNMNISLLTHFLAVIGYNVSTGVKV